MIPYSGPLGTPLREEEFYQIADGLTSIKVNVYAGDIVPVSEKVFRWLSGELVYATEPEGDYFLLSYNEFQGMLTDRGYVRL